MEPQSCLKISIIMPALNEENNIHRAIENAITAFNRVGVTGEIIVINDGSKDNTAGRVHELSTLYPFIRIIHHSIPRGIGASFWEGVKEAKGDVVTMLPGDGENDGYEILRYLPLMDNVDIVVPFIYNRRSVRAFGRRVISKVYKMIINISFGVLLNYMNGTVMYRRRALDSVILQSTGFFYQTELLIKCIRLGYLFAEVPCAIRARGDGRSKALSFKSLLAVIHGYISTFVAVNLAPKEGRAPLSGTVTVTRAQGLLSPSPAMFLTAEPA